MDTGYKFEMQQAVKLVGSSETGKIIGRAEFLTTERSYLVRYMAGDGRQVEVWWAESALEVYVGIDPEKV